jgi:hypothetical protein
VVATALVHSAVNLSLIETFKKWPLGTELALLAGGIGAFIIGVAVLG